MNLIVERIHQALQSLSLLEADALLQSHLERAAQQELSYADFLGELLEAELAHRRDRALSARTRMAGLPYQKTLAQFDFAFQPSVDQKQVRELQTLGFVEEASNIVLLGPPGVGKTQSGYYPYRHDVSAPGDRVHHRSASSPLWADAPTRRYHQPILSRTLLRHRHARRCRA